MVLVDCDCLVAILFIVVLICGLMCDYLLLSVCGLCVCVLWVLKLHCCVDS